MTIRNWSTNPSDNDSAPPNGAPEGQSPGSLNNVIRQVMAEVRDTFEQLPFLDLGHTATRTDADTFTVPTDLTSLYTAGRSVKFVGATTEYATILSSSYSDPTTTVEVSGTVPTSLATVSLGVPGSQARYDRTPAEIDAVVTPDYAIPSFDALGYNLGNRFRVLGDAITSDTNAIQRAIDSTPEGGMLALSKLSGSYLIDGAGLTISKAMKFCGFGHGEDADTYPDLRGSAGVNILTIGSASGARVLVEGLSFTNGAKAILIAQQAHQSIIEKFRCSGQTVAAISDDDDAGTSYIGCTVRDFVIRACSGYAVNLNRQYNQILFESGRIVDGTSDAVYLNSNNVTELPNVQFRHVILESNAKRAIYAKGVQLTLDNLHFEQNGSAAAGPWADLTLERSSSGVKSSTIARRCMWSTAHANQSLERVHITGPDVYLKLDNCLRPSSTKIVEKSGSGTGVDLMIIDDPAAAGVWDIDTDITDVTQFTPASGRARFGGEGVGFTQSYYYRILRGSDTWDPGNLVDGDSTSTTITVTGAALGDVVTASFSLSLQGIALNAEVSATNTVRILLFNNTGGAIDLGSGTVRIYVYKETT